MHLLLKGLGLFCLLSQPAPPASCEPELLLGLQLPLPWVGAHPAGSGRWFHLAGWALLGPILCLILQISLWMD